MPRGIRVNAIAPGPMDTPFFYPQEEEQAVQFHKSQALENRLTDIKDIAPLVDFLLNDKWINGQVLFCEFSTPNGADGKRMVATPPAKCVQRSALPRRLVAQQ